jgi:hypothetical protein
MMEKAINRNLSMENAYIFSYDLAVIPLATEENVAICDLQGLGQPP